MKSKSKGRTTHNRYRPNIEVSVHGHKYEICPNSGRIREWLGGLKNIKGKMIGGDFYIEYPDHMIRLYNVAGKIQGDAYTKDGKLIATPQPPENSARSIVQGAK